MAHLTPTSPCCVVLRLFLSVVVVWGKGLRLSRHSVLDTGAGLTHICCLSGTLLSSQTLCYNRNKKQTYWWAQKRREECFLGSRLRLIEWEKLGLLVCDLNQPKLESSSVSWLLATSRGVRVSPVVLPGLPRDGRTDCSGLLGRWEGQGGTACGPWPRTIH